MSDSKEGENAPKEQVQVPDPTVEPPPKDLQNAIRKLSEAKPQAMIEMMSFAGSMGNPLHSKMEPQHITQVLDLAIKHDEREFEIIRAKEKNSAAEKVSTRRYVFAMFVIVIALVVVILFAFRSQPQVLAPILSGIGGLATGFLAGLGVGKQQSK